MAKAILLVEDDRIQFELIKSTLGSGYQVYWATTLADADEYLAQEEFDLFIVDLELPDGRGLDLCTRLRTDPDYKTLPIFLISTNTNIYTRISGLQLGADDFLVKPIHPLELKAKVENRLRQHDLMRQESALLKVPGMTIDVERHAVLLETEEEESKSREVDLTSREIALLVLLVKNEGKVLSRQSIIDSVWSKTKFISDRVVDAHIASLRRKIKPYSSYIVSEYGHGYSLRVGRRAQG